MSGQNITVPPTDVAATNTPARPVAARTKLLLEGPIFATLLRLAAPVIDATQSARPVAQSIQSFSHEAFGSKFAHRLNADSRIRANGFPKLLSQGNELVGFRGTCLPLNADI